MLSIYLSPIVILLIGNISSPLAIILLYALSGLGMAGIGMSVMHDANHGAYTKYAGVNKLLGFSLELLGASSKMWKLQHNVLHHTYTNIHGHDEDIDAPLFLLRFSPYNERYKIHRFQHLYIWAFYSLMTLYWMTIKDFRKIYDYKQMGFFNTRKEIVINILQLIPIKVFYFSYILVLPILLNSVSWGWIVAGFVVMHLIAGLVLSVIFQMAHVVPEMNFPQADEDLQLNDNWYAHQLKTTSNFSPKNRILSWYLGGLTNQIEHHLFPNICHIHYRNLSRIVQQTALEYNLPYHVNRTFWVALRGHIRTLRNMGVAEKLEVTTIKPQ